MKSIVNTAEDLKSLASRIRETTTPLALDTETQGLFFDTDFVVGYSIAFSEDEGYYIPVNHSGTINVPKRLATQLFQILAKKKLIYHNARFDIEMVFANYGVQLPVFADTMLQAYLLCYPSLKLKELIRDLYGVETVDFEELLTSRFGAGWKNAGYNTSHLTAEEIAEYAINDVKYTYKLFNRWLTDIQPYKTVYKIELNLIPIVAQLNMIGLLIDKEKLMGFSEAVKVQVAGMLSDMRRTAGQKFEPNSHPQVCKVLYEQLGLPIMKRSKKTGAPSTDADILEQLADMHEFPMLLSEYRSLSKFISGYLDKIPGILNEQNIMYASFKSIGAESGRFTCPGVENHELRDMTVNLQNQPGSAVIDVRSAFIAPEGWTWVKADFSQIEYRMMNNLAGEQNAIAKFKAGVDFHSATARMMLDIPGDVELTKEQRGIGKVLNFGISYGMFVDTVAKKIKKSVAEAKELYDRYFAALPRLKAFIQWCTEQTKEKKRVTTVFGRLRLLDYTGLPSRVAEDMIKKGFNTIVQGSSADILKMAMLRVKDRVLDVYGSDVVKMLLTVHDELDFIVRDDMLFEVMSEIKRAMEIPVPEEWASFVCELEYGPNWSELSHTKWKPTQEEYQPDSWAGWQNTLPPRYRTHLEDPEFVAVW